MKQTKKTQQPIANIPQTSPILHQVKSLKRSWIATIIGGIIGGVVPALVYDIAHHQVQGNRALWLIVAGGLVFSATNVFKWSFLASQNYYIAIGFTVLMESSLTFTQGWTSKTSLGVLIGVNAISYAHSIVSGSQVTRTRQSGKKKVSSKKIEPLVKSILTFPAVDATVQPA